MKIEIDTTQLQLTEQPDQIDVAVRRRPRWSSQAVRRPRGAAAIGSRRTDRDHRCWSPGKPTWAAMQISAACAAGNMLRTSVGVSFSRTVNAGRSIAVGRASGVERELPASRYRASRAALEVCQIWAGIRWRADYFDRSHHSLVSLVSTGPQMIRRWHR